MHPDVESKVFTLLPGPGDGFNHYPIQGYWPLRLHSGTCAILIISRRIVSCCYCHQRESTHCESVISLSLTQLLSVWGSNLEVELGQNGIKSYLAVLKGIGVVWYTNAKTVTQKTASTINTSTWILSKRCSNRLMCIWIVRSYLRQHVCSWSVATRGASTGSNSTPSSDSVSTQLICIDTCDCVRARRAFECVWLHLTHF